VTGSTFSRSGRGVDVSGGNALVDRSLFVNGGYGLYANGGAGALTHITVHGSTNDGVRVAMASGSANAFAVRDSIVSGSGGYGIYANGPLQTDHNDVWSSATANYPGAVTPGAGSISLNPLYAGPGDYHLSAGSPCIGAGNGGTDLGALSSVPAGSVDHIVVLPANSIADAGSSVTFTAQAYDAAGTAVPATYTWSAASRAGTIDQSGKLTVACAAGTVTGAVTASAAGRSGSANLTIRAGAAARIVLSPDNATVSAGGTQQYAADATDACLNTVPTGPVTWALEAGAGSISASGLLVAGTRTGTYSVSAQAQGLQGSTKVTIAESSAAAIHITPASVTIAPGGVTTLSAVVTDASGNPTSDPVTWSCNPAAGAISAGGVYVAGNTPGIHTGAIVAASGSLQARATVIISAAALSQLVLQPVWPSVRVGGTVQFTASGVDGAGNSVPVTATWSILRGGGTLSAEGLFTAGHVPGTWLNTVQATASGLGATATVVTTPGPAVLITVSPTRPTLAPGGTQRFTAKAMDVYGNETGKTGLVWTADPRAGTIDAQGTFTAGAAGGDYDDSVVAALGNISGTASVRIGQSDPGDAGVSDGGPPAPVPVRGCGSAGGAPVLGLLLILALRRRGRLPA
jgi:hypothetical protein